MLLFSVLLFLVMCCGDDEDVQRCAGVRARTPRILSRDSSPVSALLLVLRGLGLSDLYLCL